MPELPEVEIVRRVLEKDILNKTITKVEIFYEPMITGDAKEFKTLLENHHFVKMDRIGKYLLFYLDNDYAMISHLRMEGKYFYSDEAEPINKHIHVLFYFDNGKKLMYQDIRKFGRMELKLISELKTTKPLSQLGPEPFVCNPEDLHKALENKKIPIKTALLDQSILLGLGNIYVDEVLHAAKIMPNRVASLITKEECAVIILESQRILNLAIKYKGTTIRSYTSSLGVSGEFQNLLCVHTKEFCKNCNTKIIKVKIGGRGTYYCSKCQR